MLVGAGDEEYETVRYEVSCGLDEKTQEVGILSENVRLCRSHEAEPQQLLRFPRALVPPSTLMTPKGARGTRLVISNSHEKTANFHPEVWEKAKGGGWMPSLKLGRRKSALANIPADEREFPIATWLHDLLTRVQSIVLNSTHIRNAGRAPDKVRDFSPMAPNLPGSWLIFEKKAPERFEQWIAHLRTALSDLDTIRTVEREDDRHRYLVLRYKGGLEVPSWVVSDGTLRMLALTLPAYLPQFEGVYLIEDSETGSIRWRWRRCTGHSLRCTTPRSSSRRTPPSYSASPGRGCTLFCQDRGWLDGHRARGEHPALPTGRERLGVLLGPVSDERHVLRHGPLGPGA